MNSQLNAALHDDPIERVGRLLTREGHAPQTIERVVGGYQDFIRLAVAENMQGARDAATEEVMAAWDLSRLDTIGNSRLMGTLGHTGQLFPIMGKDGKLENIGAYHGPKIQPLTRQEQDAGLMNFDWQSLQAHLEVQDGSTPANARAAVHDFKEYLAQQMWNRNGSASPGKLADKAWHRLILDPHAYGKLKSDVLGSEFHHIPTIAKEHCTAEPCGECKDDIQMAGKEKNVCEAGDCRE